MIAEPSPNLLAGEFTLEAWVNPSFSQRSTLIDINRREPESKFREKLYRLALLSSQQQTVYPSESFRFFGNLWPYGEDGTVSIFSAGQYRSGSWHHVVAVRRQERIEIYLDGKPAEVVPAPPLTGDASPVTITIGRFSGPQQPGAKPDRAHFKGLVDEVALYPSALSAKEIAEHYRLMKVK